MRKRWSTTLELNFLGFKVATYTLCITIRIIVAAAATVERRKELLSNSIA